MHPFKQFLLKNRGFSLIEALITTSLLVIILSIMLQVFYFERTVKIMKLNIIASKIALSKTEELKKTNFSNLPPNGTSTFDDNELLNLPQGKGTIFREDYLSTSSLTHIIVKVEWQQNNSTSSYQIDSVIYKNQ